jgi:nicotinic acid phosphoribosyltransferase
MHRRIASLILLALTVVPFGIGAFPWTDNSPEPAKFFRDFVGLNDDQIRQIREGKAVAKILDSPTAEQVYRQKNIQRGLFAALVSSGF